MYLFPDVRKIISFMVFHHVFIYRYPESKSSQIQVIQSVLQYYGMAMFKSKIDSHRNPALASPSITTY